MLFHFHYHRPVDVAVHAETQEQAQAAVEEALRKTPSQFRPGGWLLDAAYLIAAEATIKPDDFVVHEGRVVRAYTIDTRTIPMPWGKKL